MRLKPIDDHVVVRPIEADEVTPGGIVIPDNAREKSQRGVVEAVGEGRFDSGQRVPLTVRAGDEVIFSKYAGTEIKVDGQRVQVMREAEILVVVAQS